MLHPPPTDASKTWEGTTNDDHIWGPTDATTMCSCSKDFAGITIGVAQQACALANKCMDPHLFLTALTHDLMLQRQTGDPQHPCVLSLWEMFFASAWENPN